MIQLGRIALNIRNPVVPVRISQRPGGAAKAGPGDDRGEELKRL